MLSLQCPPLTVKNTYHAADYIYIPINERLNNSDMTKLPQLSAFPNRRTIMLRLNGIMRSTGKSYQKLDLHLKVESTTVNVRYDDIYCIISTEKSIIVNNLP